MQREFHCSIDKIPMMDLQQARVAIVSDTHTVLDVRIAAIIRDCDFAVHAGDIGCHEILQQMQPRISVIAVAGNNDYIGAWPAHQSDDVARLPHIAELHLPGGKLAVEHGHRHGHHRPDHDLLRAAHPSARAIVYGHTHKMVCDQSDAQRWVINPGAAGITRNHGGPSCLVLTASEAEWQVKQIQFTD